MASPLYTAFINSYTFSSSTITVAGYIGREMVSQTICTVFICLLVLALIASSIGNCVLVWLNTQRTPECPAQQVNPAEPVVHNERSNVFADLSVEEFRVVCNYMSKTPGMNISFEPASPPSADYLYLVELSLPKKRTFCTTWMPTDQNQKLRWFFMAVRTT